jgi:signal peptidase
MTTSGARRWWVAVGLVLAATLVGVVVMTLRTVSFYAVQTGSMSPTIPTRSLVVVAHDEPVVGDVITYWHSGALVTHRLVAVNTNGTFETRGDANNTADAWPVHREDVVGTVVAHAPELGYAAVYLRTPAGFVSFALTLLLIGQIWSWAAAPDPVAAFLPRHAKTAGGRAPTPPGFGRVAHLRPCIVVEDGERLPGRVLAWERDGDSWRALVRHASSRRSGTSAPVERWLPRTRVEPH